MSGPLVGLVREHGPQDHNAWAVLTVIAEGLRGPLRTFHVTTEALGRDARLSRSSTRRALAVLVAEGWVDREAGRHTGTASTYRLRLEAFPAEAVEDVLERGPDRTPVQEQDLPRGVHTEPFFTQEGSTQTREGSTQDPLPSVQTTVTTSAREQQGSLAVPVGVAVGGGADQIRDAYAVVMAEVDSAHRPNLTRQLRRAIGAALDRGMTGEALADLWRRRNGGRDLGDLGPGWAATELETITTATPKPKPKPRPKPAPRPEPVPVDPEVVARGAAAARARLAAAKSEPVDQARPDHSRNGKRQEEAAPIAPVVAVLAETLATEDPEERAARHAALYAQTMDRARAAGGGLRRRA